MKRFNVFITIMLSLFLLLSCRGNDEPSNYTISFETNCEKIVDDKIVNAGDNYTIDFELTYMDWTLEGWYYDIELTNPYDPLKPITSNITLYASWSVPVYDVYHKVYFNANGGTYRYSLDVISNDTLDLDDIPTKRNHTFLGWYLDEDLTVIFDLNTIITSDITLYAKWEITKYTLSYETFGGTNIDATQYYITESTTTPISPEKVGAEFIGWFSDAECTQAFEFGQPIDEDTTIYAGYDYHTYSLTYITCGGNPIDIDYYKTNELPTLPTDCVKEGFVLEGWYLDPLYEDKFDFDSYIYEDTIIYAKWVEKEEYSNDASLKTFKINGQEIPNFKSQTTSYSLTLPAGVDTVVVYAETSDTKAKILSGIDTYKIELGNVMLLRVIVRSPDGTKTKSYSVNVTTQVGEKESVVYWAGLSESIAAIYLDSNPLESKVYYKESNDIKYIEVDKNLIRNINGLARVDILGLKKGTYDIKIVHSDNSVVVKEAINVSAHDRSGYAFYDTETNAIGAYNEDGTLKDNADVIYITNENKNTVSYKGRVGIVSILSNASSFNNPVCIRIIGSIETNQFYYKNSCSRLADDSNYQNEDDLIYYYTNSFENKYKENIIGLKSVINISGKYYVSHVSTLTGSTYSISKNNKTLITTYNGTQYPEIKGQKVYEDDSSTNMVSCTTKKGLTIEGVGTDAELLQWGIQFKNSYNVEVKNLTFTDYPEDAVSFNGDNNNPIYNGFWIHNCTFNRGLNNWDMTGEKDKPYGDGSIDIHAVYGLTLSYCVFKDTYKTGLVGSDETAMQYDITFHHNYYNNCRSRLPLTRNSNIHIYNNYYINCKNTITANSNAYIFLENNYFDTSKYGTTENSQYYTAKIKSFGNYYTGCNGDIYESFVKSRTELLSGILCSFNGISYANFDTNPSLFYYDSINKVSNVMHLTSAAQAKDDCINYSGVLKEGQKYGIFR